MSATLLLNVDEATLTVHTNSSKLNTPIWSFTDPPSSIPGYNEGKIVILGDAHTHQVADLSDDRNRAAIAQMPGDGRAAAEDNRNIFTIDSQNVDAFKLGPKNLMTGQSSVTPKDNIGTTQDLNNNKFSILRTALEYFGGKN